MIRRVIVLSSLALFAATFSLGCKREDASAAAAPTMPPAMVTVAPSETRDVPIYLQEIGKCTASEVVAIQPQVSGVIKEIHFVDGADVKKGQMLFTIDPRPYEAALAQAKAMLSMNSATLTLVKQELDRVQGMNQTNAISKEEFEQRQNAVSVADAQVEAAHASIATAQVNLDYCSIKSPIDGRAGQRLADVGNVVTPAVNMGSNTSPLLTIQKLDPIYADFTITESHLPEVRKYMAEHTLKTEVWTPDDASANLPPHDGDLTFLNNAIQDNTGTIKLRATLKNSEHHFWPGQFVNIRLVLKTEKDAVLVPQIATQISQQGPFVYVVKEMPNEKDPSHPAMIAQLRQVTLGQEQPGNMVVVEKGVSAGEKVITGGQMMVRPDGPVMIAPAGPPGANMGGAQGGPATAPATGPASH